MKTDKMIPIDFCRKITPFVSGDVYYNNFVDAEFTMDQQDADGFNNAYPKGVFNTYFIVSFADRPNTGKQPVADDVVIDRNWASKKPVPASAVCWTVFYNDETWKPNHEAMLAKFKEQGASTMNTDSKNHHIAITIEALGSQPVHHIDLAVTAGAVQDVREPRAFSSEFYATAATPKPKPIYTQEMAKHRQAAPIGSSVQTSMGEGVVVAHGVSYGRSQVVIQTNETMLSLDDSQYYPLDSRTDEDKAISDLDIAIDGRHTADVLDAIKADKITGVKWVGK